MISTLDIFDFTSQQWQQQQTTGEPPPGIDSSSVALLGSKLFFFGGYCGTELCWHNAVQELDLSMFHWRELKARNPRDAPTPKNNCGSVAFQNNGEQHLCVFGGWGVLPVSRQAGAFYSPHPEVGRLGWNNELHLFNLQTSKKLSRINHFPFKYYFMLHADRWLSPEVTGERPPPCDGFSFTPISPERVIMFGGLHMWMGRGLSSDVFILDLYRMVSCSI